MGYYRPQTITRYGFPSNPQEYWFDWKNFVAYGETKSVTKQVVDQAKASGQKAEDIPPDIINAAMLVTYIAAWNVTDPNDVVLPLSPESIDKLEDVDAACLMDMLNQRMSAKAVERKN